jgi:hypothetical protein
MNSNFKMTENQDISMIDTELCQYLLATSVPLILKVDPKSFLLVSSFYSILYLGLFFSNLGTMISVLAALWHLIIITCGTFACQAIQTTAKKQLSTEQSLSLAADRCERLLHAIIPRSVLSNLASFDAHGLLATQVSRATVMFCSLEGQGDLLDDLNEHDFDVLHSIISEFDRAVGHLGLFKYQHVGQWYIVTCPRAERPFEDNEQAIPYPEDYTARILQLAFRLQNLALQHVSAAAGATR